MHCPLVANWKVHWSILILAPTKFEYKIPYNNLFLLNWFIVSFSFEHILNSGFLFFEQISNFGPIVFISNGLIILDRFFSNSFWFWTDYFPTAFDFRTVYFSNRFRISDRWSSPTLFCSKANCVQSEVAAAEAINVSFASPFKKLENKFRMKTMREIYFFF